MYRRKISYYDKKNTLTFILLAACILCFSGKIFSQKTSHLYIPRVIKLANVDTGNSKIVATYEQVLSNPQLLCIEPGCEVIGFDISFEIPFKPENKYYGPFETKGSKINKKQVALLEQFKKEKAGRVRVYIDNIKTKKTDGTERIVPAVVFTIIG